MTKKCQNKLKPKGMVLYCKSFNNKSLTVSVAEWLEAPR